MQRAGAGENRNALSAIEHCRRTTKILIMRKNPRWTERHGGVLHSVLMLRLLVFLALNIMGHDDARDRAMSDRDANGPIDHVSRLLRLRDYLDIRARDILC